MKDFAHILQPPLAAKTHFVVDVITDDHTRGRAYDIAKIKYNIALLPEAVRAELELYLFLSDSSLIEIYMQGRFVIAVELNPAQTMGHMLFWDHTVDLEREALRKQIVQWFSQDITGRCLEAQQHLKETYQPSDDGFEITLS